MKRFLMVAFKITPFQIFVIASFSTLKYVLNTYNLTQKIEKPLFWTCFGVGILFVVALSIYGILDNKRDSSKNQQTKSKMSKLASSLNIFVNFGIGIPIFLGYALFLYLISPTSWFMFIALLSGIIIGNITQFFETKSKSLNQETN